MKSKNISLIQLTYSYMKVEDVSTKLAVAKEIKNILKNKTELKAINRIIKYLEQDGNAPIWWMWSK